MRIILRHASLFAALFLLAGCPYISGSKYEDDVKDYDGDGVVAERFGGDDCRDNDPDVKHCDFDKDGHQTVAAGGDDCDDENAQIFPGADERCNGVDDNCDGLIDDDDATLIDAPTWFIDDDRDGYGDPNNTLLGCDAPSNTVEDDRDCDDSSNEIHPGATEFCDDIDRNCDNDLTLGAVDPIDWYTDNDGDGAGSGPSIALACAGPTDSSENNLDCNDDAPMVFPGAIEVWYDGLDSDCDGASDFDADRDGHDRKPEGGDCDDLDLDRNPNA
ncbi:MAG: hypothetical protein GWP91_07330, partial [Rhodobacterales bacterium]|nr:hypothetical protein [Rhodobacterales bacterium]